MIIDKDQKRELGGRQQGFTEELLCTRYRPRLFVNVFHNSQALEHICHAVGCLISSSQASVGAVLLTVQTSKRRPGGRKGPISHSQQNAAPGWNPALTDSGVCPA